MERIETLSHPSTKEARQSHAGRTAFGTAVYDFAPLAVIGFPHIVQSKQRRKRVTAACDLPIIQTSALLLA
jgi:hypothetical protein